MVATEIPGKGIVQIKNLLLDLNGTIATDGVIAPKIKTMINTLSQKLRIFILSADTQGNLEKATKGIKGEVIRIPARNSTKGKKEFLQQVEPSKTAVIGNGYNDLFILKEARLGIGVIGREGASVRALLNSDIVVRDIFDALDLLIHPLRIKATLRR
ncbi:MAG: ATPase P [Pseudomonadota bacterium]